MANRLNSFLFVGFFLLTLTIGGCGGGASETGASGSAATGIDQNAAETESTQGTITVASGGDLSFADGTTVSIPAGALSTDTQVTVTKPKQVTDLEETFGGYIKIEPDNLSLSSPATITFPYDPNKIVTPSEMKVISYSEGNTLSDLGSEQSYFERIVPTSIDTTAGTVTFNVSHFSVFSYFWEAPAYLVFDLPGKYLKKGDLLYVLTDATGSRDDGAWFPGHTGIYLGTTDANTKTNDGSTILESTPRAESLGITQDGVQTSTLSKFKSLSGQHIFLGARRPKTTDLTDNHRSLIAQYALDKVGVGYRHIGGGSFLNISDYSKVSCVGITELAYEAAGINLVPEISELLLYPIRQFNRTKQVDTVDVLAGEEIDLVIYGLIRDGLRYDKSSTDYTISAASSSNILTSGDAQVTQLVRGVNFKWTPKTSQIGESIKVDFTLSGGGLTSVTQSLTFNVTGEYFPVRNGAQYTYSETQTSSDTEDPVTLTAVRTITTGTPNLLTEVIDEVTQVLHLSEESDFWVQTKFLLDGDEVSTFDPYARIIRSNLHEVDDDWGSTYDIDFTANVAGGPFTVPVTETVSVAKDKETLAVTAGTFEEVIVMTRSQTWDVPDIQGTDGEGNPTTVRTDSKTVTSTEYYAPGVGLIKLSETARETITVIQGGNSETTTTTDTRNRELVSYAIP